MKKVFVLLVICTALFATQVSAQQGGGDPAAMMARMKERVKPQLVEKTKLSDEQADKVLEIYVDAQRQRRELRNDQNLSDDDRRKKSAEIDAARDKKFTAIPLTAEQVKSVSDFFEEMRRNMQQRNGGGGNGGGNR